MALATGLIWLIFIVDFHGESWGADWREYAKGKFATVYYDASSVTEVSANTLRVWQKVVYSQQGTEREAKNSGEQYRRLSESLVLTDID